MSVRVLIHTAAVEDVSVYTRSREPHRSHGSLSSHTQSKMEEKIEKKSDGTCGGAAALRSRRGTRHRLQGHHHPGGKDWVLHGLARAYHVRETFMYVFTFLPCLAVMWFHTARESARLSLVE